MDKISYVSEAGLNKLKAELAHMQNVERPAISRQIAEARDKGDLSENAEYDAAKEAQGILEARIHKLEAIIANSRILDESRISTDSVQIMSKVKLKNLKNKAVVEYMLVSESEANLREGKISINTPIGQGLFEIMEISR